jgi:SpoVK/Ycf46/Vps4 family AAA+-type ATPase
MGQSTIGAAVLHHLEGFHIQNLDLATLVSDSTRTLEAACVQLFVEAKRHKPSILFIPQLASWCASVGETVRATITGLLDGLEASDPILLLAVVEGEFRELPADVRRWFGFVKGNRVVLWKPGAVRLSFFLFFSPFSRSRTQLILLTRRTNARPSSKTSSPVSVVLPTNTLMRCPVASASSRNFPSLRRLLLVRPPLLRSRSRSRTT